MTGLPPPLLGCAAHHHFEETGSSNAEALALARSGAAHLTLVTAARQRQGRGRLGRDWQSPAGNLFWSLILRPPASAPPLFTLSFVAALAIAEAVDLVSAGEGKPPLALALAWPNDVLLAGAKLSGCLIEVASALPGVADPSPSPPAVVVGIGINVAEPPAGPTRRPATCLRAAGLAADAPAVGQALTRAFLARYAVWEAGGLTEILTDWTRRCPDIGREVEVSAGADGAARQRGRFEALDSRGLMQLRLQDGRLIAIAAGDVVRLA